MAGLVSPGVVWSIRWDFKDGKPERLKYFVVLNDCASPGDAVVGAFTTSQGVKRYGLDAVDGKQCGVSGEWFRVPANLVTVFGPDQSWVQFDNLLQRDGRPLTVAELHAEEAVGRAQVESALPEDLTMSLLFCATRSDDIEGVWTKLIKEAYSARDAHRKSAHAIAKAAKDTKKPFPKDWSAKTIRSQCEAEGISMKDFYDTLQKREIAIDPLLNGPQRERLVADIVATFELLRELTKGD